MQDTSTIDLLIDMAKKKRDAAATRMAEAIARCTDAENKLALLSQYLADYQVRQRTIARTDAVVLCNFHGFLNKLEDANCQQRMVVHAARRAVLQARNAWEQALQHFKAIEILQERRAAAAQLSVTRAQQKQHDEQAARMLVHPLALAG